MGKVLGLFVLPESGVGAGRESRRRGEGGWEAQELVVRAGARIAVSTAETASALRVQRGASLACSCHAPTI